LDEKGFTKIHLLYIGKVGIREAANQFIFTLKINKWKAS
jgi:hypothetical protein